MSQVKTLLLQPDLSSSLAAELCEILNSSSCLNLKIKSEAVKLAHTSKFSQADLTRALKEFDPDLCFVILLSGLLAQAKELLQLLKTEAVNTPVVVVMDAGEPDEMIDLLKYGVVDFLTPPLKAIDILPRIWKLTEGALQDTMASPKRRKPSELKQLIGESPAFLAEINKIPLVAKWDASVLISGETGSGKELYARAIHYCSPRAQRPFVPINCGAIPSELVENELFGHERGAYTSAQVSRLGLIQEADGGTLFLDEVDCLPLLAQVKLLRFLQDREYRPLGSTKVQKADVRVVAATNMDLEEAVNSGRLRRDIYYRLNVIPILLPSLRNRCEDIPLLTRYFLSKYVAEFDKPARNFSPEAMQKLLAYNWPGNVRELEHVVQRATLLSEQPLIQESDIILSDSKPPGAPPETFQEAKMKLIKEFEKSFIQKLLLANQGNVSKAARAANKNRRAFWQLICKHQIDVQRFRVAFK